MFVRVAVPGPFLTPLDYKVSYTGKQIVPVVGGRVSIYLRGRKLVGVVMATSQTSKVNEHKIQPIQGVIDVKPIFSELDLELLKWAAYYYHEPIGNVVHAAMPKRLREGLPATMEQVTNWQATDLAREQKDTIRSNAVLQNLLMEFLLKHSHPVTEAALTARVSGWRPVMKRFVEKGWALPVKKPCLHERAIENDTIPSDQKHPLNEQQQKAVDAVMAAEGFEAFLLQGVTGSGKTETYLGMIEAVLAKGQQALVLVPEIGLTPQTVARFEAYLQQPVAVMHSALSDKERHCAWYMMQSGQVKVLLGTRSAVFTPFQNLGLCILDEEHDLSFKQQDNFRYSARDCLVRRAQLAKVPVVLGSATPSLETLHNAFSRRYRYLQLTQRAGGASMPSISLLDIRGDHQLEQQAGISTKLKDLMQQHLQADGQVLLFLNRRGFAPVQICHDCGWQAVCQSCDANMTYHHQYRELKCHHCGHSQQAPQNCPACGSANLMHQGQGTEKLEAMVNHWFPDYPALRVDRDTTKTRSQIERVTAQARSGEAKILIGTQMLAKGHHFPQVTLVAMIGLDQGLFSCDFRAAERMAQLIVQVAGRAGRADKSGEVVIQTCQPQHPLLNTLVDQGYEAFARQALTERQLAMLPPDSFQIMLRAESNDPQSSWTFLQDIQQALSATVYDYDSETELAAFGPVAAPMLRKQGRYRYQLLLQARQRSALHQWLGNLESHIYAHSLVNLVRWSIDVDPQDMS